MFAVGDVTGDRRPDIVVTGWSHIMVHAQQPDGTFVNAGRYREAGHSFGLVWRLSIADVTGDGINDVVATIEANRPHSAINIFEGSSHGLAPPVKVPSLDGPEPVVTADLNGDGLRDVVVLHGGWLHAGYFLQQPDGSMSRESLVSIPYSSHYEEEFRWVGDLNGDGKPDIVIVSPHLMVLEQV
jgi:hypothetical protein